MTSPPIKDWSDIAERAPMQLQPASVHDDLVGYLVAQAEAEEIEMML